MSREALFWEREFREVLEGRERELQRQISEISEDEVLGTAVDEWVRFFCEKYAVEIPSLLEDQIEVSREDARVDVSRHPSYAAFGRPSPVYVEGTAMAYHVPFDGDPEAFSWRPSTYTSVLPRAGVADGELVFSYVEPSPDAAVLKQRFDADLGLVRDYLARG
jgi:hypothetical protein